VSWWTSQCVGTYVTSSFGGARDMVGGTRPAADELILDLRRGGITSPRNVNYRYSPVWARTGAIAFPCKEERKA
jgi:hypothetical protein